MDYYSLFKLYSHGQLPVSQLSPSREEVSAEDLVSGRDMDSQRGSGDCWSRRLSQTEHESRDRP
ncbi:hypothetical protein D4764_08G0006170 [Takifugu flavidus]|uniref:Uncharacterized protein n=1 Tax=Takifugu flavidus TaxID=433684 RepID=A0A5C6MT24_9TELE|nr:hypothetical protein D4764_08G0006170 [Takifugu flavidus]